MLELSVVRPQEEDTKIGENTHNTRELDCKAERMRFLHLDVFLQKFGLCPRFSSVGQKWWTFNPRVLGVQLPNTPEEDVV